MSPALRSPVLAAWGAGVDSTAMLIELIDRGEPVDQVLFADVGAEKAETLAQELFILQIMGDDRAVAQTYVAGRPQKAG